MFKEIFILTTSFAATVIFVLFLSQISILNAMTYQLSKLRIPNYRQSVGKQLTSSGNPGRLTPDKFISLRLLCGLIIFFLTSIFLREVCIISLITGVFASFLPSIWLREKLAKRHLAIRKQLPYFLDLFVLSVEAGMDFISALNCILEKVGRGALHEEFSLMLHEIRMGKMRREAMEDMRNRVNLPELSSLTTSLIQADMFGISLGKILRVQSEELRRRQSETAEKLAMKAPVKLLLPLVGFIFPAVFIVLLGPILLQLLWGGF